MGIKQPTSTACHNYIKYFTVYSRQLQGDRFLYPSVPMPTVPIPSTFSDFVPIPSSSLQQSSPSPYHPCWFMSPFPGTVTWITSTIVTCTVSPVRCFCFSFSSANRAHLFIIMPTYDKPYCKETGDHQKRYHSHGNTMGTWPRSHGVTPESAPSPTVVF